MNGAARVLVDGRAATNIDALDRGLAYGDGLFETVLVVGGQAPLWPRHLARLAEGCARLALPSPDAVALEQEIARAAAGLARAVVRITLTRGCGPRGYAPPRDVAPTRLVAAFAAPPPPADWYRRGIRVRFCELRLAEQPRLAGLKHLNRLEQVLARAEWDDPAIAEGLLRDAGERVISATAANLFVVIDGALATPALTRCGVAGVARAELLSRHPDCQVRDLSMNDVMNADELFLTSSVRGIVPVTALADRRWPVGAVARALQAHWAGLGFAPEDTA